AAYTAAAERIPFRGETLNRLAVLDRVSRTSDPVERRELFLSLGPTWRSVNGDDGPASPYRELVRLRRAEWAKLPEGERPFEAKPREMGLDRATLETWLTSLLEQWRAITPDREIEPWDYAYTWGAADRLLAPRIPRSALRKETEAYYETLGASPRKLGIR